MKNKNANEKFEPQILKVVNLPKSAILKIITPPENQDNKIHKANRKASRKLSLNSNNHSTNILSQQSQQSNSRSPEKKLSNHSINNHNKYVKMSSNNSINRINEHKSNSKGKNESLFIDKTIHNDNSNSLTKSPSKSPKKSPKKEMKQEATEIMEKINLMNKTNLKQNNNSNSQNNKGSKGNSNNKTLHQINNSNGGGNNSPIGNRAKQTGMKQTGMLIMNNNNNNNNIESGNKQLKPIKNAASISSIENLNSNVGQDSYINNINNMNPHLRNSLSETKMKYNKEPVYTLNENVAIYNGKSNEPEVNRNFTEFLLKTKQMEELANDNQTYQHDIQNSNQKSKFSPDNNKTNYNNSTTVHNQNKPILNEIVNKLNNNENDRYNNENNEVNNHNHYNKFTDENKSSLFHNGKNIENNNNNNSNNNNNNNSNYYASKNTSYNMNYNSNNTNNNISNNINYYRSNHNDHNYFLFKPYNYNDYKYIKIENESMNLPKSLGSDVIGTKEWEEKNKKLKKVQEVGSIIRFINDNTMKFRKFEGQDDKERQQQEKYKQSNFFKRSSYEVIREKQEKNHAIYNYDPSQFFNNNPTPQQNCLRIEDRVKYYEKSIGQGHDNLLRSKSSNNFEVVKANEYEIVKGIEDEVNMEEIRQKIKERTRKMKPEIFIF